MRSGDTEAEVSHSLASRLFKSSTVRCFANNLKPLAQETAQTGGIVWNRNFERDKHCTLYICSSPSIWPIVTLVTNHSFCAFKSRTSKKSLGINIYAYNIYVWGFHARKGCNNCFCVHKEMFQRVLGFCPKHSLVYDDPVIKMFSWLIPIWSLKRNLWTSGWAASNSCEGKQAF